MISIAPHCSLRQSVPDEYLRSLTPPPEPRRLTLPEVNVGHACTVKYLGSTASGSGNSCHHPRRRGRYDTPMPCETRGVAVTVSVDEASRTLPALIDRIAASHHAIEIVSNNGRAVLMPADVYTSWQTAYLFRSPKNARRLLDAYERALTGSRARTRPHCRGAGGCRCPNR